MKLTFEYYDKKQTYSDTAKDEAFLAIAMKKNKNNDYEIRHNHSGTGAEISLMLIHLLCDVYKAADCSDSLMKDIWKNFQKYKNDKITSVIME
ncbi:hypothetical protein [Brachyspira sp.]|uniref:hypothetical protein n=1 Tax=Brachyspira sp. TaxID=1977261 RepID=UPI003D7EDDEA